MMNRYEEFRIRIMERAATVTQLSVTTRGVAKNYGIPESHIRDELIRLANWGSISLSAWDGERERAHDEWPDADSLFANEADSGHVRIRLLSTGRELLSK